MLFRALLPLLLTPLLACTKGADSAVDSGPALEQPWPDWAWTHWVWEDESTQESALALVQGYLDRDIPVGAIIIDSPWATGYSTFEWDRERFPDPQGMIDTLHDQGVRVMIWTVPGINVDVEPLYSEGVEKGYFMKGSAESEGPAVVDWWKGDGSLIDYFNPEAVAWWHGLVDQTLDYGIDGWKCDGLDFSALVAPYSPGAGREVERLEYSHAYYQDFHDYTRERLGDDRMNTARPIDNYGADVGGDVVAFAPVEINWAGWVGDQDASFEGLQMALRNLYYSAEYGYVGMGSDIGGYREDSNYEQGRSKELLIRWAQLGAFNPVMENGGGGDHHPWAWDEETVSIYRTYVKLHHAMLPYLYEEGAQAFAEGRSLMDFKSSTDYRFYLGPDVFVAPILEEGGVREVQLPSEGSWVDLFDPSQIYEAGSSFESTFGLEAYPVYVREGSEVLESLRGVLD